MVDFRKLLSPEALASLDRRKAKEREVCAVDNVVLAEMLELYYKNSSPPRYSDGTPMEWDGCYDAVLYHVLIPEVIKRLKRSP